MLIEEDRHFHTISTTTYIDRTGLHDEKLAPVVLRRAFHFWRRRGVARSRRLIAERFSVAESLVRAIEEEGLDHEWPPL